ncbi:MAG: ABC transporter substrate-binding protein, partial [Actinomycetota bacterium]|nr:ABC transporter substrate-binding protein [Actinomycetota bacterium]
GGGGQQGGGPAKIIFSFGPDETGTLQEIVDRFNQQNEGEIEVEYRQMSRITDEYFDELSSEFGSGSVPPIDVIGGDVIWAPEFAANGWIEDLSRRMYADYSPRVPDAFLSAAMTSVSFRNDLWGVPWFTDVGLLYYRRDLLEDSGFTGPPKTWDGLKEMANKVTQDAGTQYGFVFQGDAYEGGVVNGCEYIWSANGEIMRGNISVIDPDRQTGLSASNIVEIDSDQAVRGLSIERSMIEDGVAPQEVASWRERESLEAFNAGDAVFLRGWPYMYQIFAQEGKVSQDQVGIAELPVAEEGMQSWSCLGGWNMYINSASQNKDAAWEFIKFATSPEIQKFRAIEGSFLPTLNELYNDQEIQEAVPVADLGGDIVRNNARTRPISPFYSDISHRLASRFNSTLKGDISPEEAVSRLQNELENIVRRQS